MVLRSAVFLLVVIAPLLVPVQGGGSGSALVRRAAAPDPRRESAPWSADEPAEASATPPAPTPGYPLFLRPLSGEPAPAATKGPRKVRELVLTFDDGPDLLGTPLVLEELDRRGLKAIFFVNGSHLVGSRPQDFARRDLVRKLAAHGHLVANHTLNHRNVCKEPETLEQEIDGNAEIIVAATGVRPLLFRSPYGARCKRLDEALAARDLLQVGWNLDPQEWRGGSDQGTYDYVTRALARLTGRATLLLHDTNPEAVHALPRLLDWIARESDRASRAGEPPIVIRDYSVFLPSPPLGPTGLEPFARDLRDAFSVLPALALK